MNYSKRKALPLGSIKAEGFLKEQLIRSKNGIGGHLPEIEPGMIAAPYIKKAYVKRWANHDQSGWGAEISGNYYTGLVELAFTLNDPELIKMAETWIEAMMKNRLPNGYLGTYTDPKSDIYDDYNAWGTTCGMRALLSFYEATGREEIFEAVRDCMLWFTENWDGDKKSAYAGQFIIEPMIYCYHKTGDKRFLDFCTDYEDYLCRNTLFANSYKDFLEPKLYYNSNHTAAYGINVRMPAWIYTANGEKDYLNASLTGVKKAREKAVHVTGAPVSMTEYIGPVSATAESEFCCFTFFNATYAALNVITGDSRYGEMMEEVVYNAAQGARKNDERAIAYLTSPNQVFATVNSSNCFKDMQVYAPCYPVSCCPVNAVAIVPEFIRGMAVTDDDGELYISAYGPCSIEHNGWSVKVDTEYPFRHTLKFNVTAPKGKKLHLRIPSWCKGYDVSCAHSDIDADGYISICGELDNTEIELSFKADVEVIHVDDSDASNKRPIAFKYGALIFSMPIEESWQKIYPETETPLAPEWPWYNVNPVYTSPKCRDTHEAQALKRDAFSWNIAVDENITADQVSVEFCDTDGAYPWDKAPVKLTVPAYKAPYAVAPYACRTLEPFGKYLHVTEERTLTLVPYGQTALRITYFPLAEK